MKLVDLNVDCLLVIFGYCGDEDLLNLCRASWQLRNLIEECVLPVKTLDILMCGHRNKPSIEKRTQTALSFTERLLVSRNWRFGRYHGQRLFYHRQMFPTKLHLERDWLYITHINSLRQYRRGQPLQNGISQEISGTVKTDIADFVKKKNTIFAGRVCGSCFIHENNSVMEQRLHSSREFLYCVDFANELYVTGTDQCGKLWRRTDEFCLMHLDLIAEFKNSYKAFRFTESGDRLYGGLYTDVNRRALREVDLHTYTENILNSDTISIYDLKLKDQNIIFTANYDTTFRIHDRRSGRDVSMWEDPFDSSFYCLEYDGLYGILCGAKYHSRVNLYDIRVPERYIQLYFPARSERGYSSPVYDVVCDSRYLFVAADHQLNVLDFKVGDAQSRDFCDIFREMRRY